MAANTAKACTCTRQCHGWCWRAPQWVGAEASSVTLWAPVLIGMFTTRCRGPDAFPGRFVSLHAGGVQAHMKEKHHLYAQNKNTQIFKRKINYLDRVDP